jgi:type IV fimbrial biogenesis protein FimT
MGRQRQRGFTLWELLMTLLVAAILIGIGVPNVMEFQRSAAMTAAANDYLTAVLVARTEAVKRQAPVVVCLSDDPLAENPVCSPGGIADSDTRGYFVWVDDMGNTDPSTGALILTDATDGNAVYDAGELVLRRTVAPGGSIRLSTNCGYIAYTPNGFTRAVGTLCNPQPRAVLFCDDRGRRLAAGSLSSARAVRVDVAGRGQVLQETADVDGIVTGDLPASGINPNCP